MKLYRLQLASLEEFYEKKGIGMMVIYGRRRIGKSTLITEFVKDKKTIFYETLRRRADVISAKYKITKLAFFSLSGYTDWVEEQPNEDVILLTLDNMYE